VGKRIANPKMTSSVFPQRYQDTIKATGNPYQVGKQPGAIRVSKGAVAHNRSYEEIGKQNQVKITGKNRSTSQNYIDRNAKILPSAELLNNVITAFEDSQRSNSQNPNYSGREMPYAIDQSQMNPRAKFNEIINNAG
jgi:ABC-type antimicrobial peptide transport system permease subunit